MPYRSFECLPKAQKGKNEQLWASQSHFGHLVMLRFREGGKMGGSG